MVGPALPERDCRGGDPEKWLRHRVEQGPEQPLRLPARYPPKRRRGGLQNERLGLCRVGHGIGVHIECDRDHVVGRKRPVRRGGGPRPDKGARREVDAGAVVPVGGDDKQLEGDPRRDSYAGEILDNWMKVRRSTSRHGYS
jgi:hypothetical protein